MRISRSRFVLWFLACGFAYGIATRLILNQMPGSLGRSDYGSVTQAPWQITVSTMLIPLKFVLMGPLLPLFNWMLHQQDADPPPPMLAVMYAAYWTVLALAIHYFLSKLKPQPADGGHHSKAVPRSQ
jgi:hypothetical protein